MRILPSLLLLTIAGAAQARGQLPRLELGGGLLALGADSPVVPKTNSWMGGIALARVFQQR